jgi:hypothetical protein
MGHRFHAKTHGEPRLGYLFVKLSRSDRRRRRKHRKFEESRLSKGRAGGALCGALRRRLAVRPPLRPFQAVAAREMKLNGERRGQGGDQRSYLRGRPGTMPPGRRYRIAIRPNDRRREELPDRATT